MGIPHGTMDRMERTQQVLLRIVLDAIESA